MKIPPSLARFGSPVRRAYAQPWGSSARPLPIDKTTSAHANGIARSESQPNQGWKATPAQKSGRGGSPSSALTRRNGSAVTRQDMRPSCHHHQRHTQARFRWDPSGPTLAAKSSPPREAARLHRLLHRCLRDRFRWKQNAVAPASMRSLRLADGGIVESLLTVASNASVCSNRVMPARMAASDARLQRPSGQVSANWEMARRGLLMCRALLPRFEDAEDALP